MKAVLVYIAIFALILLAVPMLALGFELNIDAGKQLTVDAPAVPRAQQEEARTDDAEEPARSPQWQVVESDEEDTDEPQLSLDAPYTEKGVSSFRILDESTGEVVEVGLRDFVRGAVAAEMPVSFHIEALKAQAVAAHTYALHNHLVQQENPDPELKGADFSADPGNFKVYMTEADARDFYGDSADRSWKKICEAADSVLEYVLEYDDEPIVAAYHAISAGQTEDASNVWTGSAPYLQPANSEGDLLAPDYESRVTISADSLETLLSAAYPDIALGEDPAVWFGAAERSGSGYVIEIEVGDGALHGKDIRQLLELRSHNFEVEYTPDSGSFAFQVYGYGHGVGLSQYGADYLARQDLTFDAILGNYFTDAELKRIYLAELL